MYSVKYYTAFESVSWKKNLVTQKNIHGWTQKQYAEHGPNLYTFLRIYIFYLYKTMCQLYERLKTYNIDYF